MASLDLSLWLPIGATWALALGTLAFASWQLRQNQRLHSTTTLLDLRDRFYSTEMRRARRSLSGWLSKSDRAGEADNWEVALFFELLGSLTRAGILDRRPVRKAFGTWITSYYIATRKPVDLFAQWRKESNDPLILADFEWLAGQVIAAERRNNPGPGFDRELEEESHFVLEGESELEIPL